MAPQSDILMSAVSDITFHFSSNYHVYLCMGLCNCNNIEFEGGGVFMVTIE